jgi:hypothetical protein
MRWNTKDQDRLKKHKDLAILLILILLLILNIISIKGDTVYVLTDGKTKEAPELDLFCSSFIEQIINKGLQRNMVEPDIYDVLVSDNYKILNLAGSERVLFSRTNDSSCSVIVKDQIGLRRFEITVNKSTDYPFYYRVQKIDEPTLEG